MSYNRIIYFLLSCFFFRFREDEEHLHTPVLPIDLSVLKVDRSVAAFLNLLN